MDMHDVIQNRLALPLSIFALFYAGIVVVFLLILNSDMFASRADVLSAAMLADLLLTAPIVYWLLVRKTGVPAISVIPICLVGFLFAGVAFPEAQQEMVKTIRSWILPLMEVGVLVYLGVIVHRAASSIKTQDSFDRKVRIENAARQIFGHHRIASIVAAEFTMIYYLFRWPAVGEKMADRMEVPKGATVFSYHKDSGMTALWLALMVVVLVELTVVHVLLAQWSMLAAWLASLSSVYIATMIIAQMRAIRCRPIFIHGGYLHIVNGMFRLTKISLSSIASFEITGNDPELTTTADEVASAKDDLPLNCSVPVSHNVILKLHEKCTAELLYGATRRFQIAALHVDDPRLFADAVSAGQSQASEENTIST